MACLGLGTTWLKCMLTRDEVEEFVNLDKIKDKDESEIEYPQAIIAFGYPQEGKHYLGRHQQYMIDIE